jgi:hypothetical protein
MHQEATMNSLISLAGRPLFVDGQSRSAVLGEGKGWESLNQLDLTQIDPPIRKKIAEQWARDALFEHASVASFSRFSLHLMAVAAPPHLLDGSHRAALDEIRHAKICFALASAYAGEPLGPGPLPLEGDILGPLDLPTIAVATVREGCIGETIAALEADQAREVAQIVPAKEALSTIAEDESRHAELAWQFVRWAIDVGGKPVRDAVRQAFDEVLSRPAPPVSPADDGDDELERHGRLSDPSKRAVYVAGLNEVIRPAAEALLNA